MRENLLHKLIKPILGLFFMLILALGYSTTSYGVDTTYYLLMQVLDQNWDFVENASVTIDGYGTHLSASNGAVKITGVPSGTVLNYTITKAGFDTYSGSYTLSSNTSLLVNISQYVEKHNASFKVEDAGGYGVEGATVIVEGYGSYTTDSSGYAYINDVPVGSVLNYTGRRLGFEDVSGSVTMGTSDLLTYIQVYSMKDYSVNLHIVDENSDPINNVSVIFTNLGTYYTDSNGDVSVTYKMNNTVSYTASLSGYPNITDSFQMGTEDQNITLTFDSPYTYTMTFEVVDAGGFGVEGATVTLEGFGTYTTDVDGCVYINDVLPGTVLNYTGSRLGYDDVSGSLTMGSTDSSKSIQVYAQTQYDVTFHVVDENGDPLEGVTVVYGSAGNEYTDVNGDATKSGYHHGATINYTVFLQGYELIRDTATIGYENLITNVTLEPTLYTATFKITDLYGAGVAGAKVTIEGDTDYTTDADGYIIISGLLNGSVLNYTASRLGYEDVTGSATVDLGDLYKNLQVSTRRTYNVTFRALDLGGNPVEGASVVVSGFGTYTTNADGEVIISVLYKDAGVTYDVSCDVYASVTGAIPFDNVDNTIEIEMTLSQLRGYTIYFRLIDGEDNIAVGATLKIGEDTYAMDENGRIAFENIIPGTTFDYTSNWSGYAGVTNTYTSGSGDATVYVVMNQMLDTNISLASVLTKAASVDSGSGELIDPYRVSVSVSNSVTNISPSNILAESDKALIEFYGEDGSFVQVSNESVNLTEGSTTSVYAKVIAENATSAYYKIAIQRLERTTNENGNNQNNTSTTSNNGSTNVLVNVNGVEESGGIESKTTENGVETVTVEVDKEIVESKIDSADVNGVSGVKNSLQVPIGDTESPAAKVELTGDIVKKLEEKNFNVSIKRKDVEYIIPAEEFTISKVAQNLGVEESDLVDIKVEVKITKLDEEVIKSYQEITRTSGAEIVFPPVSFDVTAKTTKTSGVTESVKVEKFSAYVERVVELIDGIDPSNITTGIVFNADGTYSHVPTTVYQVDGKWYAKLNSLTNSNYAVIYNEAKVASVSGLWSEDAVNDMASRLIIENTDQFDPNAEITRAEYTAYLIKALGLYRNDKLTTSSFKDVPIQSDYALAIQTAKEYGIVSGYSDGSFRPEDIITRQEAMAMVHQAMSITKLDLDDEALLPAYIDLSTVSSWAVSSVTETLTAHIYDGVDRMYLSGKDGLTYAEAAQTVKNLLVASNLINP